MDLETVLKKWADIHLKPQLPALQENRQGKLVYQDSTSCSASWSRQDIYLLDDDHQTYRVFNTCTFEDDSKLEFTTLAEVLDYLVSFCGHDPNATGDMLLFIINNAQLKLSNDKTYHLDKRRRIPILAKCADEMQLIAAIDMWRPGLHYDPSVCFWIN